MRRALGVPSEGEDIFTMSKIAWNVNNINDVAMASLVHSALLLMGIDGICSPHGAGGIGTLSCPLGFHLLPKQVAFEWGKKLMIWFVLTLKIFL